MAERTVHQLTEDFNELVVRARERGVAMWATHHRSDFSSRKVAEQQLSRLRVALGEQWEDRGPVVTRPVGDKYSQVVPATIIGGGSPATIIPPKRILEVSLDLPADDMVIAGPSVNWRTTATLADGTEVTHLSLASEWFHAMMLAVAHWRKTKAVPPRDAVTVRVERG